MSNEAETIKYSQPEINWDNPTSYEASSLPITQLSLSPLTSALAQEDIHQGTFPQIENFFPPLENPSIAEMRNTRINLEPVHAPNAEPSNITMREEKEEFGRIVDTIATVLNSTPDLSLSHVIYMVKDWQYSKVMERISRKAFYVMDNKQNKVRIFKSPKKILTGVGQWDTGCDGRQEQGYMWVFSVPRESIELAFNNTIEILNKGNLMTLNPQFNEDNPYTLFLTRRGWKYAISFVPVREAE